LQFGDRQTDERWTRTSHEAALAVASGGLISALQMLLWWQRWRRTDRRTDGRKQCV